jgi:hypothetical protein
MSISEHRTARISSGHLWSLSVVRIQFIIFVIAALKALNRAQLTSRLKCDYSPPLLRDQKSFSDILTVHWGAQTDFQFDNSYFIIL